jgi:hypothetical protein
LARKGLALATEVRDGSAHALAHGGHLCAPGILVLKVLNALLKQAVQAPAGLTALQVRRFGRRWHAPRRCGQHLDGVCVEAEPLRDKTSLGPRVRRSAHPRGGNRKLSSLVTAYRAGLDVLAAALALRVWEGSLKPANQLLLDRWICTLHHESGPPSTSELRPPAHHRRGGPARGGP